MLDFRLDSSHIESDWLDEWVEKLSSCRVLLVSSPLT